MIRPEFMGNLLGPQAPDVSMNRAPHPQLSVRWTWAANRDFQAPVGRNLNSRRCNLRNRFPKPANPGGVGRPSQIRSELGTLLTLE